MKGEHSIHYIPKTKAQLGRVLKQKDWRMNNLWTVVDKSGKAVPFRQNKAQRKFYLNKHLCNVIYKDRQRGMTTEECIDMLDDAFFMENLSCGVIAHRMQSAIKIFDTKIRFPYESLPDGIKNLNPAIELDKTHIKFKNGSSIHVDVSFRSDTIHRLLISEWAKICSKFPQRAIEITTGTIEAVHPQYGGEITIESTSDGGAGDFYELCQKAHADTQAAESAGRKLGPLQYKRHTFLWHEDDSKQTDPEGIVISDRLKKYFNDLRTKHGYELSVRQMAWYAIKKEGPKGLGKRMKQEHPSTFDEAFEGSVEGAVYGDEILEAYEEGRIARIPVVEKLPVYTAWDLGIGKGNAMCVIFFQFVGDWIHLIDYIECEGRGVTWFAPRILNRGYAFEPNEPFCFCPHDVQNRSKETATPLIDTMRELKLRVCAVARPKNKEDDGIQAVKNIFKRLKIDNRILIEEKATYDGGNAVCNHFEGCDRLVQGLKYYRYPWDEDLRRFSNKPLHDWASNPADALQTLALAVEYDRISGSYHGTDPFFEDYYEETQDYDWIGAGRFR